MAEDALTARRAALGLLLRVTEDRRLMSDLLPGALQDLAPEDRARAQRLALTVLRWMDRADRMLGPFLKARPQPAVLHLLRLGLVEMAVDGAAPHGVVDSAVSLARERSDSARAAGLVNAVLRRVAGRLGQWDGLPVPRLPKWLRKRLLAVYGKAAVEAMEAAHAAGAPLDLTAREDAAAVAAQVGGVVLPTGSVRLAAARQVSALPGYAAGDWWVQDAAAALPARVLAPRPGERVLDLCAAPGGKTLQLAAAGAAVTALDISAKRLERLAENLARTRMAADCIAADALHWTPAAPFDAVLLDAPCTATGTIRRHPDLPYAKDGTELAALADLQAALIDRAAGVLRPGGRLVYCTCSLLPEEGEAQVAAALKRRSDLAPDPAALDLPGIEPAWRGEAGLRLRTDYWADRGGMDGFFVASLRKAA